MGGKSSKPKDKSKPAGNKNDKKKSIPVLTDDAINLIIANTNYDREKIIDIYKKFNYECPSGRIDKKSFEKLFKSTHTIANKKFSAEKYCAFVFNAFDKNKDGFVDFNEFCTGFSIISSEDLRQKVQFAFRHYDLDRDEKINKADILKVVQSKQARPVLTGFLSHGTIKKNLSFIYCTMGQRTSQHGNLNMLLNFKFVLFRCL